MEVRLATDLQTDSIVDGVGIRTTIWFQGCLHNCPGCHNPETHDLNGGVVWAYTGFTYEALVSNHDAKYELLNNIDVLVDGRFMIDLKSLDCKFRGSTNQRVIKVKESLESGEVVNYEV